MIIQIALSSLPSQEFRCVLDSQYCSISLSQKGRKIYMDLFSGDRAICQGAACEFGVDVVQSVDPAFKGTLHFYDFDGREAPEWTGLDERWVLVFLPQDEAPLDWMAF